MPSHNWNDVQASDGFTPLPEGEYLSRLDEVKKSRTRNDDEMWTLQFTVLDEKYKGRKLWDRITFSEKGLSRVKLVIHRLGGIKLEGEVDVNTQMILGKSCKLVVYVDEYIDKVTEQPKKSNKVHFDGYIPLEHGVPDEDLPF